MSSDKHHFHLKHDFHWQSMSVRFKGMQVSRNLVDVTLSCEGKKIEAHKMVLSASSSYFSNIFEDNPCKHPVIIFRNISFSDLEALVDFMYTGEVSVTQENLDTFLSTADTLQIHGLIQMSSSILPASTSMVQNCERYSDGSLLANSAGFEEQRVHDLLQCSPFDFTETSSNAADEFACEKNNYSADLGFGPLLPATVQDTPLDDPLYIDHAVDDIPNDQATDEMTEDVKENWWTEELKLMPVLTTSTNGKVKIEKFPINVPRLKIRPCSELDDKRELLKLHALNKKSGRVQKSHYKIKTETPSRIQPSRTKKFTGIRYTNIKKCLEEAVEFKKNNTKKNKSSPNKKNYSTRRRLQEYTQGFKIKNGTRKESLEVNGKIRKSSRKCPVCKQVFTNCAAMQNHVLIEHHLIPAVDQWRSLSCMKCSASFDSRKILIDHLFINHYNTIVCTVCKKIFTGKKVMRNHFIDQHVLRQEF